jgi:tetratricopeptide (TPR) repeat protein
MRHLMLAPMILLLGSNGAPLPYSSAPRAASWCGGDLPEPDAKTVVLKGYGPGGFKITTKSAEAQAFFDNGLQLAQAFAHKAAIKAFQEARRLDPDCAMCTWGEAWSSGPTINYGIKPEEAKTLAAMAEAAEKLAANGPVRERNLIGALKLRYVGATGDRDFADAMAKMAAIVPNDDALATLAADAGMIAAAEWNADTLKRPVALLESVLGRNPDYAPAIHFYIHATEGSGFPARAEKFADRLGVVAPAASHLVHMPSHTYYWIGRYGDAATSNLRAVEIGIADARQDGVPGPDAEWKLLYHGHNVHFGLGGALMSGDAEVGLKLARPMIAMAARAATLAPFRQFVLGEAYMAVANFGSLAETLAIADPGKAHPGARILWRYARGEAYARAGNLPAAEREGRLAPRKVADDKSGRTASLSLISRNVLAGRIAMLRGRPAKAVEYFAAAAAAEEAKPFSDFADPPLWWYPVRRDVAAALLAKGDAAGALAAADASLKRRPLDPVALAIRGQAKAKLGARVAGARDLAAARSGWRGKRPPNGA